MAITQLNPYLTFNGTAEQAIRRYESALGARTDGLMRFGDGGACADTPPTHKHLVMHARLHLGGGVVMVSDAPPDRPVQPGHNVHVCLDYSDADEMARQFEALAAGGKVTMPLADTFWGARFGVLVDAFGVGWMFNCMKQR